MGTLTFFSMKISSLILLGLLVVSTIAADAGAATDVETPAEAKTDEAEAANAEKADPAAVPVPEPPSVKWVFVKNLNSQKMITVPGTTFAGQPTKVFQNTANKSIQQTWGIKYLTADKKEFQLIPAIDQSKFEMNYTNGGFLSIQPQSDTNPRGIYHMRRCVKYGPYFQICNQEKFCLEVPNFSKADNAPIKYFWNKKPWAKDVANQCWQLLPAPAPKRIRRLRKRFSNLM